MQEGILMIIIAVDAITNCQNGVLLQFYSTVDGSDFGRGIYYIVLLFRIVHWALVIDDVLVRFCELLLTDGLPHKTFR